MVQTDTFLLTDDPGGLTIDPGGGKPPDDPGGGTPSVRSPSALPDDVPSLLNKVNLDGSSANDNPGSRDFNTPNQLASSNWSRGVVGLVVGNW